MAGSDRFLPLSNSSIGVLAIGYRTARPECWKNDTTRHLPMDDLPIERRFRTRGNISPLGTDRCLQALVTASHTLKSLQYNCNISCYSLPIGSRGVSRRPG